MNQALVSESTARVIDSQVSKIIRGLGNPKPPLDLEAAFRLQKLDPQYYRAEGDGVVRETISRVKVGAKLVFEDPIRIWNAIKKLDLKALYIPEQQRILIDASLHAMKQRWSGAHELGHSILDWHRDYTWGDTQQTLLPFWYEQIEAEANYAAGRLLFLQDDFEGRIRGRKWTLQELESVSRVYGNSWTSTLYRAVETLDVPAFATIGAHPKHAHEAIVRYFVASPPFREQFAEFTEDAAIRMLRATCGYKKRGPLGEKQFAIANDRGETYEFDVECFGIYQGDVLTLAQATAKRSTIISVGVGSSA